MKYKNTKTGVIFETSDEITGKDWVKLSPGTVNVPEEEEPEEKPKRKRAAKE